MAEIRLIIQQDGVKRQLASKPFSLCTDQIGAKALMEACARFIESGTHYGWFDVYEHVEHTANCPPDPWKLA